MLEIVLQAIEIASWWYYVRLIINIIYKYAVYGIVIADEVSAYVPDIIR